MCACLARIAAFVVLNSIVLDGLLCIGAVCVDRGVFHGRYGVNRLDITFRLAAPPEALILLEITS